jgi:hypothetical protein
VTQEWVTGGSVGKAPKIKKFSNALSVVEKDFRGDDSDWIGWEDGEGWEWEEETEEDAGDLGEAMQVDGE